VGKERMAHGLFGGAETLSQTHKVYEVTVRGVQSNGHLTLTALNQDVICGALPRISDPVLLNELEDTGIYFSDAEVQQCLRDSVDTVFEAVAERIAEIENGQTDDADGGIDHPDAFQANDIAVDPLLDLQQLNMQPTLDNNSLIVHCR